jgi:beta-phosphoglucomutase-like phosphatase (HAD superfamily)
MHPSALIFDFNGVLVDDELVHLKLFQQVLSARHLPLSQLEYFSRYFVFDDAGVFRQVFADRGQPLKPESVRSLCEEKARLYAALPAAEFRYFPASEALARDAARHVPLAIASGARGDEIRRHLDLRGLTPLFRAVVAIEDVARSKPHPEPFLEAARRIGVPPASCVAVEDSPGGVAAARAAGMRVVAVTHSVPKDRLQADLVFETLEGLTWADLRTRL